MATIQKKNVMFVKHNTIIAACRNIRIKKTHLKIELKYDKVKTMRRSMSYNGEFMFLL